MPNYNQSSMPPVPGQPPVGYPKATPPPPPPTNQGYPGYYRQPPANVSPYNYDANNAPNWNDRKFTSFFKLKQTN